MISSPVTLPAPELPSGRRVALVMAIGSYADASLTPLDSAARDATEMAGVLSDPNIGSFEVTSVVDGGAQEIRLAVEDFLEERHRENLVVVYMSCHGLLDKHDRLYFAAKDTRKDRLAATGVEAVWLWNRLEECRATRQIVILDCCNSGSFARAGGKGEASTDLRLPERFVTDGRGRVVLTASRANQPSWEGDPVGGMASPSVFTSALVEGLRTGSADTDGDGYVSVDEAYAYAYRRVIESGVGQVPQRSLSAGEGTLLLARNPAGRIILPVPLPQHLRAALESPHPAIRVGAVNVLEEWLKDPDPAKALSADQILQRIAADDVPSVAAAARARLNARNLSPTARGSAPEQASEYSVPSSNSPAVIVSLAQGQPPAILSSSASLRIENIKCIDHIPDYEAVPLPRAARGGRANASGKNEDYKDYYREAVRYYQSLRRLQSLRFAIQVGDQRLLDLYIDIKSMKPGTESGVRFARSLPTRPGDHDILSAVNDGVIIGGGSQITQFHYSDLQPHQELKVTEDKSQLQLELELPKLLPRRTFFSKDEFHLTATKTSTLVFDAKIYPGAGVPYSQQLQLKLEVVDLESSYREILSALHIEERQ